MAEIQTLNDLKDYIAARTDLSQGDRGQMKWAINKFDDLVGHGMCDLPADPALMNKLKDYSPALAGLSKGAFANLKSRLRRAFRIAKPEIKRKRADTCLTGSRKSLYQLLDRRSRMKLSRLLRYMEEAGWEPKEMTDAHIERFEHHLREEILHLGWRAILRDAVRTWNEAADAYPEWPEIRLTPIPPKRTPYWIALSEFPETFKVDVEAYLAKKAGTESIFGQARPKLTPKSLENYHTSIITLASAQVRLGRPSSEIASLMDLVAPGAVQDALKWLYKHRGEQAGTQFHTLCIHAISIARDWAKLPENERHKLEELRDEVRRVAPPLRRLAPKNRDLLDRLSDDDQFREAFALLPLRLQSAADNAGNPRHGRSRARDAIAMELLQVTGLRRANIINLRLDENIKKYGTSKDAHWVIDLDGEDVKNDRPIRREVTGESAERLEWYLEHWHHKLCSEPTAWLFPNEKGGRISGTVFCDSIKRRTKSYLGVAISPHQFRHMCAQIYVDESEGDLETASQFLNDSNSTTRTFYARPAQRAASRRYQGTFGGVRQRAGLKARRKARKKDKGQPADSPVEEL